MVRTRQVTRVISLSNRLININLGVHCQLEVLVFAYAATLRGLIGIQGKTPSMVSLN